MSRYPSVYAGQLITGSLLEEMLPDIIRKSGHEDRFSTIALTADSELQVALAANAVYEVTMHIHYATTTAAGFQTDWSAPSGASGNRSSISNGAAQNSYADVPGNWGVHNLGTAVNHGNRNSSSNQLWLMERGTVTTTNAGTLALRWAQVTSSANVTRVAADSTMTVRRLS